MVIDVKITGEPGTHGIPRMLFNSAVGFFEGALRCGEPVKVDSSTVLASIPSVINIAFSAELYLKSLISDTAEKVPKIHKLDELFDQLTSDQKAMVKAKYSEIAGDSNLQLEEHLQQIANAFVDWRYSFEGSRDVRIDHMFDVARALHDVIRELHPDWNVTEYLQSRIVEGPTERIAWMANLGGGHIVQAKINLKTPSEKNEGK